MVWRAWVKLKENQINFELLTFLSYLFFSFSYYSLLSYTIVFKQYVIFCMYPNSSSSGQLLDRQALSNDKRHPSETWTQKISLTKFPNKLCFNFFLFIYVQLQMLGQVVFELNLDVRGGVLCPLGVGESRHIDWWYSSF